MSSCKIIGTVQIIWQSSCKYRSIFPPLKLAAIKGAKEKIKEILSRLVEVCFPAQTLCNLLSNYIIIRPSFLSRQLE